MNIQEFNTYISDIKPENIKRGITLVVMHGYGIREAAKEVNTTHQALSQNINKKFNRIVLYEKIF